MTHPWTKERDELAEQLPPHEQLVSYLFKNGFDALASIVMGKCPELPENLISEIADLMVQAKPFMLNRMGLDQKLADEFLAMLQSQGADVSRFINMNPDARRMFAKDLLNEVIGWAEKQQPHKVEE